MKLDVACKHFATEWKCCAFWVWVLNGLWQFLRQRRADSNTDYCLDILHVGFFSRGDTVDLFWWLLAFHHNLEMSTAICQDTQGIATYNRCLFLKNNIHLTGRRRKCFESRLIMKMKEKREKRKCLTNFSYVNKIWWDIYIYIWSRIDVVLNKRNYTLISHDMKSATVVSTKEHSPPAPDVSQYFQLQCFWDHPSDMSRPLWRDSHARASKRCIYWHRPRKVYLPYICVSWSRRRYVCSIGPHPTWHSWSNDIVWWHCGCPPSDSLAAGAADDHPRRPWLDPQRQKACWGHQVLIRYQQLAACPLRASQPAGFHDRNSWLTESQKRWF